MKVSPATAADILKTFIQEDRTEVRLLRDRIQNVTSTLVLASFAITSFLAKDLQNKTKSIGIYSWVVDALLIIVIIVHFARLKNDLLKLRKALKARQNILVSINCLEQQDIDPFPDPRNTKPDIRDRDLYWYIGLAIGVIIMKAFLVNLVVFP
jgi:hypothetical protein